MSIAASFAEKQTKDMEEQLPIQLKALTWPKEKLIRVRQERLRRLIAHAKQHSPWYKKQLKHINPETFTEEMLGDIPTINKSSLMENWDEIVTNRELSLSLAESHIKEMSRNNNLVYLLNRYRLMVTSGSSGLRGIFIYDWDEWNTYYLMFKRYRFYNHDRSKMLLNPMKKITIGAVVGTNSAHSIYSLEKTYKTRNTTTVHFPITAPMSEITQWLNQLNPDILLGSSSTIHRLCKESINNTLNISPTIISLYGEPFYPPMRKEIENAWPNAAIFNTYGTSEGLSASYCKANSHEMHLNDDLCIAEPVDNLGVPTMKGRFSKKIFITNLFNYTLPLIRYEISDEIKFLEKQCECGSSHQLILEPQTRPGLDFEYQDNIFANHVIFAYPLLADKNIREYQVTQTKNGANIKILTSGSIDSEKLACKIIDQLKNIGLKNPEIKLTKVSGFTYPASGKLRRFIPLK